jgi:hypothetical protein
VSGLVKPDDSALDTVTVAAGQTVEGVVLRTVVPQVPCQRTSIPASPDGRFPAVTAQPCNVP